MNGLAAYFLCLSTYRPAGQRGQQPAGGIMTVLNIRAPGPLFVLPIFIVY